MIDPSDVGQLTLWIADAMNRFQEIEDENKRLREELENEVKDRDFRIKGLAIEVGQIRTGGVVD